MFPRITWPWQLLREQRQIIAEVQEDLAAIRSDFCPDCGTEHHWLACPEVSQSVFVDQDDKWAREELAELRDELQTVEDPEMVSRMLNRCGQLFDALGWTCPEDCWLPMRCPHRGFCTQYVEGGTTSPCGTSVGPSWDPATPE